MFSLTRTGCWTLSRMCWIHNIFVIYCRLSTNIKRHAARCDCDRYQDFLFFSFYNLLTEIVNLFGMIRLPSVPLCCWLDEMKGIWRVKTLMFSFGDWMTNSNYVSLAVWNYLFSRLRHFNRFFGPMPTWTRDDENRGCCLQNTSLQCVLPLFHGTDYFLIGTGCSSTRSARECRWCGRCGWNSPMIGRRSPVKIDTLSAVHC